MEDSVAERPRTEKFELLFTHCWNGKADLPFPQKGPAAEALQGKKVSELRWLKEELEDQIDDRPEILDWTLERLQVGGWDGDDEVEAWATLQAPPKKKFDVLISRTEVKSNVFRVEADNDEEADSLAHEEAADTDWNQFQANGGEYETESVEEVE